MTGRRGKGQAARPSRWQLGPDPSPGGEAPRHPPVAGPQDAGQGAGVVRASWAGTALLAAAAGLGLAARGAVLAAFAVSVGMFAVGVGALIAGYVRAIARSRQDEISVAGLFLLAGSAPRPVQLRLAGAFVAQVAVALGAAGAGVNTLVASAVLAPVYGLGLMGLWGARHGAFPPRAVRARR